jgi:CheY-specific phosphatase CheX
MSSTPASSQSPKDKIHDKLLEAFSQSVGAIMREMAGADVSSVTLCSTKCDEMPDHVSVVLDLEGSSKGRLLLRFPKPTAEALASRIMGKTRWDEDDALLCDCLGEFANIVAGRAKTLLASTTDRFSYGVPVSQVEQGFRPQRDDSGDRCALQFTSDVGDFLIQFIANT